MKIFIDVFQDQYPFANKLKERLVSRNKEYSILTYKEAFDQEGQNDEGALEVKMIEWANIIITIITNEYLSESWPKTEKKLNQVYDNQDKYVMPIIYHDSDWSSKNWIVKSNIYPSDNRSFSNLEAKEQDSVINQILKTVDNVHYSINRSIEGDKIQVREQLSEEHKTIFISHDHDDADFAELLKLQLEKEGINGWIDSERLKIGQDWREEIDEGITKSIALIAIMTPDARKSEYVTYEWAFAWGKGVKIFPIMLKQTSLHPRLESLQYLDFTNRVTRPWKELIDSIKEL